MCVGFFLPVPGILCKWNPPDVTFCVWLSLSMFSDPPVLQCVTASLLLMAEYPFAVRTGGLGVPCPSVDAHLDHFHFLAVVNNEAMNICGCRLSVFWGWCLGLELLGLTVMLFPAFCGAATCLPEWLHHSQPPSDIRAELASTLTC